MAEYRLDELAQRSGVTSRNIRSYQERGLLAPPHREGRSAVYDDDHLAQLQVVAQLLNKGYTIAHIQDFFEGFAKNLDLADVLGIQEVAEKTGLQQALMAPWTASGTPGDQATGPLRLDPVSELARGLVDHGIARRDGDELHIVDPVIAEVILTAKDPVFYLRMLLGVKTSTAQIVQRLGQVMVDELRDHLVDHYGQGWIPPVEEQADLAAVITDARDLATLVVNASLNDALGENVIRVIGDYLEGMMPVQQEAVGALIQALAGNSEKA